jgi:hypothetical protein
MELKRRDVILAAIAVFIAWGYTTHWLPSLRFLPYAFILGIVVTVAFQAYILLSYSRPNRQRKYGEGYPTRNVAFIKPETWRVDKVTAPTSQLGSLSTAMLTQQNTPGSTSAQYAHVCTALTRARSRLTQVQSWSLKLESGCLKLLMLSLSLILAVPVLAPSSSEQPRSTR